MLTNNHLPMLASIRNGDAPGESSWDRQDYRDRNHLRSRFDRRYKVVTRRQLRRAEHGLVAWDVADQLAAEAPERFLPATTAASCQDVEDYEDLMLAQHYDDLLAWWCEDEADAILDEAGVETFAELATKVAAEIAEEAGDVAGSPGWGDTFDPADVQWGFTVRTRF